MIMEALGLLMVLMFIVIVLLVLVLIVLLVGRESVLAAVVFAFETVYASGFLLYFGIIFVIGFIIALVQMRQQEQQARKRWEK